MLKVENIAITGWNAAIRGMRNPYDSWEKSDTDCYALFVRDYDNPQCVYPKIGPKDLKLMKDLVKAGDCHAKFTRMIIVTMDVTAPLYWWKQADQYKIATVTDSCSTMHTIASKQFTLDDFSHEHLNFTNMKMLEWQIRMLNEDRENYLLSKAKDDWWQMIQMLPLSYNQKRTWQMDYQTLRNIWTWRRIHPLDEWHEFCEMIESLPYAKELITIKQETEKND